MNISVSLFMSKNGKYNIIDNFREIKSIRLEYENIFTQSQQIYRFCIGTKL